MKAYQKYWPQRNGKPVSLEWMRLTNKALRAFPGSPRQKAIQTEVKALEEREAKVTTT